MLRRQFATAVVVLVLSAAAFGLTRSSSSAVQDEVLNTSPSLPATGPPVVRPQKVEIKSEQWLARQNLRYFTIQLFADTDGYLIPAIVRDWRSAHTFASYQIKHNGETWNFLTYGSFASREIARRELARLPERLQRYSPRIQPIHQVMARLHGLEDESVSAKADIRVEDIKKNNARYAISLYSAETVEELRQYMRENTIKGGYYARPKGSKDPWVTLLVGNYDRPEDARAELNTLPETVREYAWVKKMGSSNLEVLSFDDNLALDGSPKTAGKTRQKDSQWLIDQPRDAFTVLLAEDESSRRLRRLSTKLGMAKQVHLTSLNAPEARRYAMVIGSFSEYAKAEQQLRQVKKRLPSSPQVITFGVLIDASRGDLESLRFLAGHELGKTRLAKSTDEADTP